MAFEGMDPDTLRIVLMVQLADLNAIAASQKQKNPTGAMTDLDLAVNSYKADLRALAQDSGHIEDINQALEQVDDALAAPASTQVSTPMTQTVPWRSRIVPKITAANGQNPPPTVQASCLAPSVSNKRKATDNSAGQSHPSQRRQSATSTAGTSPHVAKQNSQSVQQTPHADHQADNKRKARESAPSPPPSLKPRLSTLESTIPRPDETIQQHQRSPQEPVTPSPATNDQHLPASPSTPQGRPLNPIWRVPPILTRSRSEQSLHSIGGPPPASGGPASQTLAAFAPSATIAPREPPKPAMKSCLICTGSYDEAEVSKLQCGHEYCRQCLQTLFNTAINDESLFPPRCCRMPILVDKVRQHLPRELTDKFEVKKIEYNTPNRVYCHVKTCSAFIPPDCKGKCPACVELTCVDCKDAMHIGRPCAQDGATKQFLKLAVEHGWRQCFSCSRVVELNTGCYHITCKCKAHFCYKCGQKWKTCQCPKWDERQLLERAGTIVNRNPAAAAMAPAQRVAVIQQQAEDVRANHECYHNRWKSVRGSHLCEECDDRLPYFIHECRRCQIQMCTRCRFNRQ